MNRREALSAVSFLLGGTIIGAEIFLSGCTNPRTPGQTGLLTLDDTAFLDEVGETILPATASSPGARETGIGEFMNLIVTDCYNERDQKIFVGGIARLNDAANDKFGAGFMNLKPEERHSLLLAIEEEVKVYSESREPGDPEHYYTMMKQLAVWGYFSSEAGATRALRHVAVPGRFDACIPLEQGQKAWSM